MSSNDTPTVSISDLVPLVVAVLQDTAITDENEELRQQLTYERNERSLVQVTGPNGAPVYYQASLKDGGTFNNGDESMWVVPFRKKKKENMVLALNLLDGLEIRVGRAFVFFLKDTRFVTNNFVDDFNKDSDESQMGGIHFNNIPSHIFVHCKIGPIRWRDYSEGLNRLSITELASLANNNANPTDKLIITAVEFNMDKLGDSSISLLNRMGTSTTCIHDESWVASVRSTGRPPSSTFFGDVRVCMKEIKSKLVFYLEDPSITSSDPHHANQQLKLLLEMVNNPQFSHSLRDYGIISSLISVLPTVFSHNNVDDVGETNEETLKTIQETLKNQRELVKDTFSVTMKVMTEPWVVKELLEHLTCESIFSDVYLEGIDGYRNNCNRNIVAIGLFFVVCKLLNTQPNIGDKYLNMSMKLLEQLSKKIDTNVFAYEGAMTEVGRLMTTFSGNEDNKKILKSLNGMMGWMVNEFEDMEEVSTEDSLQYKYCTIQN